MRRFIFAACAWLWTTAAFAGITCTLPYNLQNGTTADATQVMANYNALVSCFGNAAKAGANTDITALLGLTTPLSPSVGGSSIYIGGTSTGSANAQVVSTTTPTGFSLTAGYRVVFIAGYTNTGALQLNTNSTGLKDVFKFTPAGIAALQGNEIQVGQLVEAIYDGTQYEILSVSTLQGGFGPPTSIASATTTDLSAAFNHSATITGTTTITSFGSNASTSFPYYFLKFSGSLTLTYDATALLLPGAGNITTQANDTAIAQYLGSGNWQIVSYIPYNGSTIVTSTPLCGASNLSITNNAGTPNTNIDITANRVVMLNSSGVPKSVTSVSVTTTCLSDSGPSKSWGRIWPRSRMR